MVFNSILGQAFLDVSRVRADLTAKAVSYLPKIFGALVLLLVGYIFIKVISKGIDHFFKRIDLDPSAEEEGEAGWGGLAEFSGRANSAVAQAVAASDREGEKREI